MLELKTIIGGQRVFIELDRIIAGQVEFSIGVGDLTINDSFRESDGELFTQAINFVNMLLNAGFEKYHYGLEYLHSFLHMFKRLGEQFDD